MNLTIAIAIYNGEKYIKRCLTSILNAYNFVDKEKLNLTILCINDGSTDNSLNILNTFSNKYDFIKVISKKNGGPASVRNLAIDACDTEFIWIVDIDDEIEKESLKFISNKNLESINVFNYEVLSHEGNYLYNGYNVSTETHKGINEIAKLFMLSPATWRYIFNSSFLKKSNIKFLENSLYEDLNWTIKIWSQAEKVNTFDKVIYKYYLTDNSIMRNANLDRRKELFKVLDDIFYFYKKENLFKTFYPELEYIALHNALYVGYLDVFKIDKSTPLLKDYLSYVNKNFKNWTSNKYYKNLPFKRRLLLLCIKYNLKSTLSLLLKLSR